ncbi:MAG: acylneuraminate cytidylyltransferase [Chloroflexi bacterium]|nr:acylneuraminate cytidylyltransferase [Chloroflexota bacterium]
MDEVVVATTYDTADDVIAVWCAREDVPCYRGHPLDVLDRYYQAARAYQAGTIMRLTADCPLLDPHLAAEVLSRFQRRGVDFAANRLPEPWGRTFPIGLDVEVMTFAALARAWHEATAPYQREHVTPYLYDDAPVEALAFRTHAPRWRETITPRGFRIALYHAAQNWGHYRWTVDTPEDLTLVRTIVEHLGLENLGWKQILAFLQTHPEVARLNALVRHRTHYDIDERLKRK